MSFSAADARRLIAPLKGKSTTFLVADRGANAALARGLVSTLAWDPSKCVIFDLDALYSSNAEQVFEGIDDEILDGVDVLIPDLGADIEDDFAASFGRWPDGIVLIDSLNTLYHMMSWSNRSSRSRKLAFFVAAISYAARSNRCAVIFTMYKREKLKLAGGDRSISELSDNTVNVEPQGSGLLLRCRRGDAWPGRTFLLPVT